MTSSNGDVAPAEFYRCKAPFAVGFTQNVPF